MFKRIGNFLMLRVLPLVIENIQWKAKTISKEDGLYFWIYLEVYGRTLFEEEIKLIDASQPDPQLGPAKQMELLDIKFNETTEDHFKKLHRKTMDQWNNANLKK